MKIKQINNNSEINQLPQPNQNSCNRSDIPPAANHSSEMKSLFGHICWSVKNYNYRKEGPYSHSANLSKAGLINGGYEILANAQSFDLQLKKDEVKVDPTKLAEAICESDSFIRNLINQIRLFLGIGLSPEELILQAVQSELDNGICFGTSLALINQMGITPDASPSEMMGRVNLGEVVLFQVLGDLRAQINQKMFFLEGLLHPNNKYDLTDCPSSLKTLSKQELQDFYDQGQRILDQVQMAFQNAGPFSSTQRKLCKSLQQMRETLLSSLTTQDPCMINLFPTEGCGHALALDLKNNRFFDQNSGVFEYSSREELVSAFCSRLEAAYPDLISNEIEMVFFQNKANDQSQFCM